MIKRHEGWKLKPYLCPAGKQTIGAGFNFDANPFPPDILSFMRLYGRITEEMAERLLTISIDSAAYQCRDIYPEFDSFSEVRQNALIDFILNVGAGTAQKFKKMQKAIYFGNWHAAADEMVDSAWFHQVGDRGPEIVGMIRTG